MGGVAARVLCGRVSLDRAGISISEFPLQDSSGLSYTDVHSDFPRWA